MDRIDIYTKIHKDYNDYKKQNNNCTWNDWFEDYFDMLSIEDKNNIFLKYGIRKMLMNLPKFSINNCYEDYNELVSEYNYLSNDGSYLEFAIIREMIGEDIFNNIED